MERPEAAGARRPVDRLGRLVHEVIDIDVVALRGEVLRRRPGRAPHHETSGHLQGPSNPAQKQSLRPGTTCSHAGSPPHCGCVWCRPVVVDQQRHHHADAINTTYRPMTPPPPPPPTPTPGRSTRSGSRSADRTGCGGRSRQQARAGSRSQPAEGMHIMIFITTTLHYMHIMIFT